MPEMVQPPGSKSRADVQEGLPRNLGELIGSECENNRQRVERRDTNESRPGAMTVSAAGDG